MPVKINGATSGSTTITAPATGGDESIELSTALAAKLDTSAYKPGLNLITPTSIAYSGGSASSSAGTTTFSGVNYISLNGVFTSNYVNYRIIFDGYSSNFTGAHIRLRASGTDTTTNYVCQLMRASSATVSAAIGPTSAAAISSIHASPSLVAIDISGPQLARQSVLNSFSGAGAPRIDLSTSVQTDSTSYDGFTIFPDVAEPTRTLTGSLRVYGYEGA